MNEYVIGIDFGTTNSRLAFIPTGRLVMQLEKQLSPVRTIVLPTLRRSGEGYKCYVGEEAQKKGRGVPRFKLQMGEILQAEGPESGKIRFKEVEFLDPNGQKITARPEALAACVIARLREISVNQNSKKDLDKIKEVTITVPAEWTFLQRRATAFAAKLAGYYNVRTLEEPVAAYLYLSRVEKDALLGDPDIRNILVFDFGGGTCDISIIVRGDETALPFVLAGSMVRCGGELIDGLLAPHLVDGAVWGQASQDERAKLAERAKILKEGLNPRGLDSEPLSSVTIEKSLYIGDTMIKEFSLGRSELQNVVNNKILPRLAEVLDLALQRAKLGCSEIDRVLMVGGSSYLREVQHFVEEYFSKGGKELSFSNGGIILRDAEAAVAFGAALHQYEKLHRRRTVNSTLSLKTYLKYEKNEELREYLLGRRGQILPIPRSRLALLPVFRAFAFKDLPLPRDKSQIEWYVWQQRIVRKDGDPTEEIVEKVKITGYRPGFLSRLRICYRIDEDGSLAHWKPYLITNPAFATTTIEDPETSLYDLTEGDIPEIRSRMGIKI